MRLHVLPVMEAVARRDTRALKTLNGEKTCFSCNKSFTQKKGLILHISVVHDKKKDFICEICEHSFGDRGSLSKHIAAVHYGNTGCRVFKRGYKIGNIQIIEFENWCNGKVSKSALI